jgi:hypothetical protein
MHKFNTQEAFLDEVVKEVKNFAPQSEDVLQAIRNGFKDADIDMQDAEKLADGSLNLRINNWILREEDIPVIETIGIVSTAVTAAFVPGAVVTAVVVTALSSFATICWKAWRKGAPLSKAEISVLGFLQVHGPMFLEELKDKAVFADNEISKIDVELALQSLTDVELRDGNIIELVRQDASGRWRASPV